MNNKQFAKALLKENKVSDEEKDRVIGTLIGQELVEYIEKIFPTYEGMQMVANNTKPFLDWVKNKFKEITKKRPDDYNFEIISHPSFGRFAHVDFTVRFQLKPLYERMGYYFDPSQLTATNIDASYINNGTINARRVTTEPIAYDWVGNATIRNIDAGAITATHIHNGWNNTVNYAEQLPPADILYNGTLYNGATVTAEDTEYPYGTIRMTERYGMGIINTGAIANTHNIDFMPNYNHAVNVTAVDGDTTHE